MSTRQMAYKGWRNALNVERKHKTYTFDESDVDTTTIVHALWGTGIAAGAGSDDYTGKNFHLHGIKFILIVEPDNSRTSLHFVRVTMGIWHDSVVPVTGNIYATGATPITSMWSASNAGKYRIFYDRTFTLKGGAGVNSPACGVRVMKYISLGNILQAFSVENTALPRNHQPFIMMTSTETTNTPEVEMHWRMYYTDN